MQTAVEQVVSVCISYLQCMGLANKCYLLADALCGGMHGRLRDKTWFAQFFQTNEQHQNSISSDGSGSSVITSEFMVRHTFYTNPKERAALLA